MGHFRDVLPSQYLGLVLKNENKHNKRCICNKIYYDIKLKLTQKKPGLVLSNHSFQIHQIPE